MSHKLYVLYSTLPPRKSASGTTNKTINIPITNDLCIKLDNKFPAHSSAAEDDIFHCSLIAFLILYSF